MKIEFDPTNAAEVMAVLQLIASDGSERAAVQQALGVPNAAPAAPAAPAVPAPVAHIPAAPAPTPAPVAPPAAPVTSPAPPAATGISAADFGAKVQEYAKATSPKNTKAFLAERGFSKSSDVPPERYGELIQAMFPGA